MIKMLINEEEVVCNKEFTITEEMLSTSSTILQNCYPKSWENDKDYVSRFYYPKDYSKCKIYNDDKLIFCGVVKNSGDISLSPRYPKYCNLQILDFKTFLSEGETLDFVISNKTIEQAINMVVDAVAEYGFQVGTININNKDEVIGAYSTKDKSAYDVLQYLADITNSKWYTEVIDENHVSINYTNFSNIDKEIEYSQQYWEENKIKDMTYNYGSRDYRNKQVMLSDEVYAGLTYTENIYSDGVNTTYNVSTKIGKVSSIANVYLGNLTVATNSDKEIGIDADVYYTKGGTQIEFQDIQPTGRLFVVTYIPLVKGRQVVYNNNEVSRITEQTSRKGVIARYETRNDATSSSELISIANSYLKYKGKAEVNLTILTEDKDLFNIGQCVYFNAPIEELNDNYMVKKKETQILPTANKIFYSYTLSSSFNSEQAINYFDNQRNKSSGNISDGDTITRDIDIEKTALIEFKDFSAEEIILENNNALNCALDSPFIL